MHLETFQDTPIIIAIKDERSLRQSLLSDIPIVFLLYGDIMSLPGLVEQLKAHNKLVLVHLDFIAGLSSHEVVLSYIKKICRADGIITTKKGLIQPARRLGLISVLRFFIIDHQSVENIIMQMKSTKPDLVEILPGLLPPVIRYLTQVIDTPIITGGMVTTKEDILQVLDAGALCVSTSEEKVWSL